MKVGLRTPSLKKSFKARTTGRAKRAMKRAINPAYGHKGVGFIKNPQKAMYNKVYQKTTVDGLSAVKKASTQKRQTNIKVAPNKKITITTSATPKKITTTSVTPKKELPLNIIVKDGKAKIGNKFYTKKSILRYRLFFVISGWFIILCGCASLPIGILFIALGIFFLICASVYKKIAKQC